MTTSSSSSTNENISSQSSVYSTTSASENDIIPNNSVPSANTEQDQSVNSTSSNPCVLCLTKEKRLACIPCGHLGICVPCGYSLRFCPICRREIEAFVKIYTKGDDFIRDYDILVASIILQKQITYIGENEENIIIPSVEMNKNNQERSETRRQTTLLTESSNNINVQKSTSSRFTENKQNVSNQKTHLLLLHLCILSNMERKCLACIPCTHLVVCTSCGQSLRLCPICRRDIEVFVRIELST
ncbi:unnamed protein product [Adineta steineri]|uniref:RING-type domain-containing protein n=1 Tax=Adineta steineri TaxID=433720 RepID=A0A819LV89_9BILA|nr:unnamed protein product [Adineta steineri]CAF1262598.1 unnamed protein product [Adineta steineri]CAF3959071.1 unnamed protein product [Adineta steineri]CAF3967646.1 unnamed protein product [Adineta steineri]